MIDKKTKANLHAGHRARMRERFSRNGFANYRPHEALEQILFKVLPRVNTNETAHMLINRFGSLENVLDASPEELMEVPGIGKRSAEYLASIKIQFADRVAAFYREYGRFEACELAFLADSLLSYKQRYRFFLALFDETESFLKYVLVQTVMNDTGGIDWKATVQQITAASENLACIIVTIMPELEDTENSELLLKLLREYGCRFKQLLFMENGDLSSLMDYEEAEE